VSPGSRWIIEPDVSVQPDGDAAFLLSLRTNQYYELNATGRRVWDLLVAGRTPDEIASDLSSAFAVDPRTARESVDDLLRALSAEGLVVAPGTPPRGLRRWLRLLRRR
jgi:hypothetical protein